MILRTCAAVQRRLSTFCDGELAIEERVAVQRHLCECASCANEAAQVREIGESLRAMAHSPVCDEREDLAGLSASVVSRLGAEQSESFGGRMGRVFEDFHVVWAALGATCAAVACVAIMVGLFYFASRERPDSLGAVIAAMASPGSNENPVSVDGRMLLPTAGPDDVLSASVGNSEEDLVFAMAAMVTREGRVTSLALLDSEGRAGNAQSRAKSQAIRELMEAISKARLQPARYGGAPVAVNVVWLHAHLTVRGKLPTELRTPGRALSISVLGSAAVLGTM
jgi:hypothetical protein